MYDRRWFRLSIIFSLIILAVALCRPLPGDGVSRERRHVSSFQDWTTRHTIYSNSGYLATLDLVDADPRSRFSQRTRFPEPEYVRRIYRPIHHPVPVRQRPGLHRDWAINLGTAGTAPNMYPAKFSFDVTQAPSCANDFVVFPSCRQGQRHATEHCRLQQPL